VGYSGYYRGYVYLGGALDWRSSIRLIGDLGWGKSVIHDGFKVLFGDRCCTRRTLRPLK
jgi:hypothetical protein